MQQPLISILVPAYNVGCYIEQCLHSIVNQTYGNMQVVIVDDGSTDRTGQICDDYASLYPYIEVYHIENGGVANARNILLSKIKGDYFLFVDSDDWIEPDMVECLVKMVKENGLEIVVCGNTSENNIINHNVTASVDKIWDRDVCIEKFLYHREINGALWNKLIQSNLIRGVEFDPEISYGEDALFIWQIIQRIDKLGITNTILYHHRINSESISNQSFGEKKMSSHKVWNQFAKDTIRLYPKLSMLAKANFAVADFWLLYYAAMDSYAEDDNIRQYRANLRENLSTIYKYKLLTGLKYLMAVAFIISYSLGGAILRSLKL